MPNAASFEVTEQHDLLAGFDVLERWRKAYAQDRHFETRRHYRVSRDLDADGDVLWEVIVFDAGGEDTGEVNAGASLLQLARELTGANVPATPGGGA